MSTQRRARFLPGKRRSALVAFSIIVLIWPISALNPSATRVAAKVNTFPAPAVLYSNDFSGAVGSEWSTSATSTAPDGKPYLGQLGNGAVSLSLDNLAAHTELTVSFDLFVIGAWAGNLSTGVGGAPGGPDIWDFSAAGGPTLLHTTFSNNGNTQAYPGTFPGASHPSQSGATEVGTLGYTFNYGAEEGGVAPSDAVYHLAFTLDNTATSVQLNFTADLNPGNVSLATKSWGIANFVLSGTVTTTKADAANLTISTDASPKNASSGSTETYTTTIKNKGPATATAVRVEDAVDQSATFISATATQGTVLAPQSGSAFSRLIFELGSLESGASAKITVTIGILSTRGLGILNTATVTSQTPDIDPADNRVATNVASTAGGVALISWQQAGSSSGDATPAPLSPQIGPGGANPTYFAFGGFVPGPANSGACTLVKTNIYKSNESGLQVSPGNLFGAAAASLTQVNVPVEPTGSSYLLTNVWNCGGNLIESGPSSPVSLPAGPKISIALIKKAGKLKIVGSGFSHGSQVFADGIGFEMPAGLTGSTKVVQKGPLTDGTSAIELLDSGKPLIVTVQNSNGGLASSTVAR